jgi:serine/threonine protein phosphatase PrpC
MSDELDKLRHSERLHQKETKIKKQMQLAKNYGYHKLSSTMSKLPFMQQPHRHHKTKIFNCGDPKCYMCGNPRKFFGEETMQEKKHKQEKFYRDDGKDVDES